MGGLESVSLRVMGEWVEWRSKGMGTEGGADFT